MTIRYFLQLLRKVTKSDDLILSLKIHFFKIFPVKYLLMPLAALRGSLGNIVWSPNPSNIFSKLSQLRGGVYRCACNAVRRRWSREKTRYTFLSTAKWIYKRLFLVGYFIKYGQYRSIKVNHSQLRLDLVN